MTLPSIVQQTLTVLLCVVAFVVGWGIIAGGVEWYTIWRRRQPRKPIYLEPSSEGPIALAPRGGWLRNG